MEISIRKFCRPAIFVPPQELTCSGSKGIISARKGTPKDIGGKGNNYFRIFNYLVLISFRLLLFFD